MESLVGRPTVGSNRGGISEENQSTHTSSASAPYTSDSYSETNASSLGAYSAIPSTMTSDSDNDRYSEQELTVAFDDEKDKKQLRQSCTSEDVDQLSKTPDSDERPLPFSHSDSGKLTPSDEKSKDKSKNRVMKQQTTSSNTTTQDEASNASSERRSNFESRKTDSEPSDSEKTSRGGGLPLLVNSGSSIGDCGCLKLLARLPHRPGGKTVGSPNTTSSGASAFGSLQRPIALMAEVSRFGVVGRMAATSRHMISLPPADGQRSSDVQTFSYADTKFGIAASSASGRDDLNWSSQNYRADDLDSAATVNSDLQVGYSRADYRKSRQCRGTWKSARTEGSAKTAARVPQSTGCLELWTGKRFRRLGLHARKTRSRRGRRPRHGSRSHRTTGTDSTGNFTLVQRRYTNAKRHGRGLKAVVSTRRHPHQTQPETTELVGDRLDTGCADVQTLVSSASVHDADAGRRHLSTDCSTAPVTGLGPMAADRIRRMVAGIQAVATDAKQLLQSGGGGNRKDEHLLQPQQLQQQQLLNWRRTGLSSEVSMIKTGKLGAISAAAGRLLLSAATAGSKGSYSYDLLAKG